MELVGRFRYLGSFVRYEYDPRKAIQLLEGLGRARGSDGFFLDTTVQRLSVEVIGAGGEANLKSVPIVADFLLAIRQPARWRS